MIGLLTTAAWFFVVMVALGIANGALEVSMNVAGVRVERRTNRPIMPVFHAGFRFGVVAGSAATSLAAAQHLSLAWHFSAAAAVIALAFLAVVRGLPRAVPRDNDVASRSRVVPGRRPVLWLLAAVALLSAVAEGASSDWSALLLVSVHGTAALAFSGFSLAMALTRLGAAWVQRSSTHAGHGRGGGAGRGRSRGGGRRAGDRARLRRFRTRGRRAGRVLPNGAGSCRGTTGKREDDSGRERDIAFVTTIAYTGFVGGPPLIGGIAQLTSLSISFIVVAALVGLIAPAALGAGRARHRELTAWARLRRGGLVS